MFLLNTNDNSNLDAEGLDEAQQTKTSDMAH